MKRNFYLNRSKFDTVYVKSMFDCIIAEDVVDTVAKFKSVDDNIKTYVGTALQMVASVNPINKWVLVQLGKRGLSKRIFSVVRKIFE